MASPARGATAASWTDRRAPCDGSCRCRSLGSVVGASLLLVLPAAAFRAIVPVLILIALVLVRRRPAHPGPGPPGGRRGAGAALARAGDGGRRLRRRRLRRLLRGCPGRPAHGPAQRPEPRAPASGSTATRTSCRSSSTSSRLWSSSSSRATTSTGSSSLLIGAGAFVGGIIGARVGRRIPPNVLRALIIVIGLVAVVKLVWSALTRGAAPARPAAGCSRDARTSLSGVPIEITDPADPRLDRLRVADRRRAAAAHEPERGLYIAESQKVIRRALAAGHRPRSLPHGRALASPTSPTSSTTPRPTASRSTSARTTSSRRCTGFHLHRGALAVDAAARRCRPSSRSWPTPAGSSSSRTSSTTRTSVRSSGRAAALGVDAVLVDAAVRRPALPPLDPGLDGHGLPGAVDADRPVAAGDRACCTTPA